MRRRERGAKQASASAEGRRAEGGVLVSSMAAVRMNVNPRKGSLEYCLDAWYDSIQTLLFCYPTSTSPRKLTPLSIYLSISLALSPGRPVARLWPLFRSLSLRPSPSFSFCRCLPPLIYLAGIYFYISYPPFLTGYFFLFLSAFLHVRSSVFCSLSPVLRQELVHLAELVLVVLVVDLKHLRSIVNSRRRRPFLLL